MPVAVSASTVPAASPDAGGAAACEPLGGADVGGAVGVGTGAGGGVDGSGFGLKSSSTGLGCVFGCGSGLNGTQPSPANCTSGQASASAPRTVAAPGWVRNPTTIRVGRPTARASTANAAANCSDVPRWPPPVVGPKRKKDRFGYAWPLGASDTSL